MEADAESHHARRLKRNSGSYSSSIHSPSSQPTSPFPRSSSLQGKSPSAPLRSSSARNSFISAASPTQMKDEIAQIEAERTKGRQGNHRASWRNSIVSIKPTSAAGAAGAGAIAAIRSRFGDGKDNRGGEADDTRTEFSGTSPQSMETARQEFSPSSLILTRDLPVENTLPLAVPSGEASPLKVPKGKEEPKRPTKSPLRVASSSSTLDAPPPLPRPSQQQSGRRVATAPQIIIPGSNGATAGGGKLQLELSRSPPRKSIEDAVQLGAFTFDQSMASGGLSISPSSPNVDPTLSNEVRLQPVPESAKRLGALTRGGKDAESIVSNDPTTPSSMTAEDEATTEEKSQISTTKALTQRYKSFRKVTPPALANAFTKSSNKVGPMPDSVTEEDTSDLSSRGEKSTGSTTPSTISKRKTTKKWMFGKETGTEAGEWEGSLPSKGNKVGRNLRGRKTEPVVNRPTIRRVFDDTRLEEDGLDSDDSEDDEGEPIQVMSSDATSTTISSPSVQSRQQARDSLPKQASVYGKTGPTSPVTPSDEISPEAKRLVRRRNVIRELVETEKSYASDLAVVRDIYLVRARMASGISSSTPLQTPLSAQSTPTHSPASTPSASTALLNTNQASQQKSSPLYTAHRNLQRMASSELPLPPSSPLMVSYSTASPSSFASSSDPGNRSSTYTVSSQTSQASDASYPFNVGNPPPLPATPPSLIGVPTSATGSTLQTFSPASNTSTSTFSTQRNVAGKPKMNISTGSLLLNNASSSSVGDSGLTSSDVRVIFAHLEACCAFAEDTASIMAASMGTFARSKKVNASEVTVDLDKEDDSLGETFLGLMARIRGVYIDYCSRHEASMLRLQEVMNSSPKTQAFFKECTELARKQTNAWDLGSLLIKPVQRVLKYPLLIQQILNSTSSTHPDYNNLVLAFDEIQGVADEINQVKKRKDLADNIITGRVKDARNATTSGSTMKGKKKSHAKLREDNGLIVPVGAEEAAVEDYPKLMKRFHVLSENVQKFGPQCTTWSMSLRDSYESQLRIMIAIRRVYRLQLEEIDSEGITRIKPNKETTREEETLITVYIRLLRRILGESWHQLDQDIRSTIAPMTNQIHRMFESPRLVMVKRDERLGEYHRYRQSLMAGKQPDKRVLENANGFIALNAQLVEELPLFIFGVQSLLDVGVQAFARLQAGFFDQVRTQVMEYWSEVAKREGDIVIASDGSGLPTMRHINHVRAFWDRHSVSAGWIDSLSIIQRRRIASGATAAEEVDQSDLSSAASTPGLGEVTLANTLHIPPPLERRGGSSSTFATAASNATGMSGTGTGSNYLLPTTNPRRPSGVAGIMRTLSGTFNKDYVNGEVPPLPSDAFLKHKPGKHLMPPSLPSLTFRDEGLGEGYFVQAAPISFLEEVQKEPYGVSPSLVTSTLPDIKDEEAPVRLGSSMTRSSSEYSGISVEERDKDGATTPPPTPPSKDEDVNAPQRHRMNILYQCTATMDSSGSSLFVQQKQKPPSLQGYLGWPFLHFVQGDTFKVLSSDESNSIPLLFGRIDRSGDLGWAEKRCF